MQGTAVLLVRPAAPLFPRHPTGWSRVEGSGSRGHRHSVHGAGPPSPIMLWELSHAPRLNLPSVIAMWEEGQHKRGPHPLSIQSCGVPPLCPHIPCSLSVLTVALPPCSPLSPSFEFHCDGLVSPMRSSCNGWCSSPAPKGWEEGGWAGLHTGTFRAQMHLSLDKGSTHP